MTQIGHSITGAALGILAMPATGRTRRKACVIVACVVLANVPDFPLSCWGHQRYDVSHSLFVNLAAARVFVLPLLLCSRLRNRLGGRAVVVGGAAAWLSHLLLDTFYNHGHGLAMFWPLSKARLALPISWFETATPLPHFDSHTARVWGIEFLSYGLVLIAVLFLRRCLPPGSRDGLDAR